MPDGPNAAWIVAVLGLYVLVSPFVFLENATGTYGIVLVVLGLLVAALAAFRGLKTDEEVPLPALPLAMIILGIITIASPFLFGDGVSGTHGATLVVSGLVFIVIPAVMINQMINEQHAAAS
jgi:peptidoglycan/LPS O-acetylase OafA/YrhL